MKIRNLYALATLTVLAPVALAHGPARSGEGDGTPRLFEQQPWGIAAGPGAADRTVTVRMSDAMRFTPDHVTVRNGETIRFIVHNDGSVLHEMVIGTRAMLDEHAELMMKFPGMAHDEPWMAHVEPGERAEIVWTFNRDGRFEFACLLPGHYQAGMVGSIDVGATSVAGHAPRSSSDVN